jgi:hypothetical protein
VLLSFLGRLPGLSDLCEDFVRCELVKPLMTVFGVISCARAEMLNQTNRIDRTKDTDQSLISLAEAASSMPIAS